MDFSNILYVPSSMRDTITLSTRSRADTRLQPTGEPGRGCHYGAGRYGKSPNHVAKRRLTLSQESVNFSPLACQSRPP